MLLVRDTRLGFVATSPANRIQRQRCELFFSVRAVQTPVFSPPAPARKTPAPAENFTLVCKFVKIGNFYSLKWKHHLCFLFDTSHS